MIMTSGLDPLTRENISFTERSLIGVNVALLDQILDFFQHTLRTDEQLTFHSRVIPGGTVGKHLRHILDHYDALFQSISSARPVSIRPVNYDNRTRETSIESSIPLIRLTIIQLQAKIQNLYSGGADVATGCSWPDEKLQICVKADTKGRAGDVMLNSTIGRELYFAFHHAIHHLAMVRVIATAELNLDVPSSFGVAPSTLAARHQSHSEHQDSNQDKSRLQTSSRNASSNTPGIVPSRI